MCSSITDELASHYVLFSVEGTSEAVVINKLIESGYLVTPDELIVKDSQTHQSFTRTRSARKIATEFLNVGYRTSTTDKLLIARITDTPTAKFVLPKPYEDSAVVRTFLTSPEIEMLIIYNEDAYDEWNRQHRRNHNLKPSDFCKQFLRLEKVKTAQFLNAYWSDIKELCLAIQQHAEHHPKSQRDGFLLADLIKY